MKKNKSFLALSIPLIVIIVAVVCRFDYFAAGDGTGIAAYFSGRLSYYLLLYSAYVLLYLGVIFRFFDIPIRGDRLTIFAMSELLFLMVIMVYTLLAASFSKKQIRIMEVLAFTSYPLFLLSDYS